MTKIMDAWEAARVTRKHTMINIRAENVAEHTWGVVHVLFNLWPSAPMRMVLGAQYHDIGEYKTGDIPAHVKWASPEITSVCESLERKGGEECLIPELHHALDLTTTEKYLLELCDRAEFCFSCYYERMLGNQHAVKPFHRAYAKFLSVWDLHRDLISSLDTLLAKNITRLEDELTELKNKMGDPV